MTRIVTRVRTLTAFLGVLAVMSVSPAIALANEVEFVIDADLLAHFLHSRVAVKERCPERFELGGVEVLLDLLEYPPAGARFRQSPTPVSVSVNDELTLSVNGPQFVLPIRAGIKTVECAEDPTCGDEFLIDQTINAIFQVVTREIDICMPADRPCPPVTHLCSVFVQTEPELDLEAFGVQVDDTCVPLDLSSLADLTSSTAVAGTGAALTVDDQFVVRVAYNSDGVANEAEWRDFFAGTSVPSVETNDWNVRLDQRLIRSTMEEMIVENMSDVSSFSLHGRPRSRWVPTGERFSDDCLFNPECMLVGAEGGSIDLDFSGSANVDLCSIGVDVDASIDIVMEGEDLVFYGYFDYDKDNWDIVRCAITTGGFIAMLDPVVGGAIMAGVMAAAFLYNPDTSFSNELCETTGEGRFRCVITPELPPLKNVAGAPGPLFLDSLFGHPEGMILGGDFLTTIISPRRRLEVTHASMNFGLQGWCDTMYQGFAGWLSVDGGGRLCGDPMIVEGTDPLDVYFLHDETSHEDDLPETFLVSPSFDSDEEFDLFYDTYDAYPAQVLVSSTAGTRTFQIDPPEKPQPIDGAALLAELVDAKVSCMDRVTPLPNYFWPEWLPDPIPFERLEQHFVPIFTPPEFEERIRIIEEILTLRPSLIEINNVFPSLRDRPRLPVSPTYESSDIDRDRVIPVR